MDNKGNIFVNTRTPEKMASFETKLPLTDEQPKQIGRITANFSSLEFVLSFCICGLITDDQRVGQIITSQMSFQNLVHLPGALFKHRGFGSEKEAAFDKLLGEAVQIERRRNQITHSVWATHPDEGKSSRVKITATDVSEINGYTFSLWESVSI